MFTRIERVSCGSQLLRKRLPRAAFILPFGRRRHLLRTSPGWKPGAFAARPRTHTEEGEGVKPSRLFQCVSSHSTDPRPCRHGAAKSSHRHQKTRLFSKQLPSPIGLPFQNHQNNTTAAEAGIEPATRRLTVVIPYQHRTHRIS